MLTDDMTRLQGDIVALRNMRNSLINELEQGHRDRKRTISEMCVHFHDARSSMARAAKAARQAALHNLRRAIAAGRQAVRSDVAGVRRVWIRKNA